MRVEVNVPFWSLHVEVHPTCVYNGKNITKTIPNSGSDETW